MSKKWYDNEISMGIMTRKYLHKGEKPEDFIPRVVSIFSPELQPLARETLENADFLPAGRTLFGAGFKGQRKVSMSNCYIVNTPNDCIESIFDTAKTIARISSYGGGCGLAIDNLRPKGAQVNNSALTSSGAVSFLNIFDVTGNTIGQNGRRAALMVGLRCDHPDIEEFLRIKQNNEKLASMNISIKFTDDFMQAVVENRSYTLYFEGPETGRIEKTINARDFFMEFCQTQVDYGDPGSIFIDRVRSYQALSGYPEYRIDISNPCLAGYTRILTDKGYFPISSLVDKEVNIWNGYRYSKVVPKVTGHNQKMVRVSFSNGVSIDCTLYHKFILDDGSRKEAKDLQYGDTLCDWKFVPIEAVSQAYGTSCSPDIVPDASCSIDARLDWLSALIGSEAAVSTTEGSICITNPNYGFLHSIQLLLTTLGVSSSIESLDADSAGYRITILPSSMRILVGLGMALPEVKQDATVHTETSRYVKVVKIEPIPDAETVYCLNEPFNHSFIAEGVLVGNCAEFFGIGGNSCNLGSINLYNVVESKFTDQANIDWEKLNRITDVAVRMLDEILDYGRDMQPLELNKTTIDDWRSIGLGIFGLADAFVAMGVKYGSPNSCELAQLIMKAILKQAIITSSNLAKEKGSFGKFEAEKSIQSPILQLYPELHEMIREQGLRNGTFLSIAPTGTISLFAGKFTGGLEPMFKIAYTRTTHSMETSKKTFTVYARGVEDLLKYHGCENLTPMEAKKRFPFLVESHEVPYLDRVRFQGAIQKYVDNAISSTVNLPNSATVDDIFKIYIEAWKQGVKGITVFRDGCKRGNILGVEEKYVSLPDGVVPQLDTVNPPSRREIKIIDGTTVREATSCVKSMYVTVNRTPDGKAFEIFTNASGGCKTNINTIARLISLALRSGVKVDRIIEELRANQCPACQVLRRQGKQVSLSCSNAIADAIESAMGKGGRFTPQKQAADEQPVINRECPECGKKTLIPEGKCVTCSNCGWSRCE